MNNPFPSISCPSWAASAYSYATSWLPSSASESGMCMFCRVTNLTRIFLVQEGFLSTISKVSRYWMFSSIGSFIIIGMVAGFGQTAHNSRRVQLEGGEESLNFLSHLSNFLFASAVICGTIHVGCFGANLIGNYTVSWIQQLI